MIVRISPGDGKLGRPRLRVVLTSAAILMAVAAVICTPFFLAQLATAQLPWSQLGDVGDAYGGASALLSAAALCGVGASLIFQQKQVKQELTSNDRQRHYDLIKLGLDNPEFLQVLEPELAVSPNARLEIYANLFMHYWLAAWELGEVDDDELRTLTAMMFRSDVARSWWERAGESWIGTQTRRGRRRFIDLVSQEQIKASRAASSSAQSTNGTVGPYDRNVCSHNRTSEKLHEPKDHRPKRRPGDFVHQASLAAAGAAIVILWFSKRTGKR